VCHQLFNPVLPTVRQMTLFFDRWSVMFVSFGLLFGLLVTAAV